ncbi:MAG: helix-turn-helix domain-containing protein [Desulfarculaceae bacterium]|nr:helix-turn-helix domain-containing protein [Desulfarculaceae bacterium]
MQAIGLTGKKLAELVGYAPVTVQVWLNGSVRLSVEKANLLEEGIDRYIADTQTTLALVQAGKIGSTTWSTKPNGVQTQGKKGGK